MLINGWRCHPDGTINADLEFGRLHAAALLSQNPAAFLARHGLRDVVGECLKWIERVDARAALAAAEAEENALSPFVYGMGDAEIARRNRITGAAGAARRALRQFEGVVYVPDTTPAGSLRAVNARVNALRNEIDTIEGALRTAKLRNASKAIAKHEAALIPLRAALAEHLTIRSALEAVVYPD